MDQGRQGRHGASAVELEITLFLDGKRELGRVRCGQRLICFLYQAGACMIRLGDCGLARALLWLLAWSADGTQSTGALPLRRMMRGELGGL